ncbi:efflux RND transporter permease subunit [uncultured Pseudoteredinibacter sp.]|uniref:efflux RND transporter permease subunit n=1 Tax=uncultured Pseudoteredinibacter sp. TaxID=1641701 RepID=UPI002638F55D|nr:efflux RND transporter permease subunit [uncultured Pseudoteredinibacter sp.]
MSNSHDRPNLMDIFVRKPVLAVVVSAILLLAGIRAAQEISILQYPKIESASLVVSTVYTGADAETVQGFITDPIERAVATVPGIDYVDSNTVAGSSTVTGWLKLNEDSTAALAELNARLSQIRFELPAGAEDPAVSVSRADRANAVFYLPVYAEDYSRSELNDYLSRRVNPILSSIDGVQRIGLEGGRDPAMRVWLDPSRLAAYKIGANEVLTALRDNNIIATIGESENARHRINLLTDSTLKTVADFEQLVVRDTGDGLIYLQDIADIKLGEVEGQVSGRFLQRSTIFISIWPLPGANEIEIGDEVYRQLDNIRPTLPDGVTIDMGYDGTLYMRAALKEIFTTLLETVFLVGIVVIALMGSFRTALVPLITIPISILGAVAAMAIMGFTLNLLTVLAVVLSVGLVVDDAIVVVENVARHMRNGMSRTQAALTSSRQLLAPVTAMTITLAAVYAPIGFLSGLTGVLFKEFAFTLAIAVLISGLVAVTLSPIMSATVCPEGGKESRMTVWVNQQFDKAQHWYRNFLGHVFNWRGQLVFAAIFIALLTVPFYMFSQKELAPIEDNSSINTIITAPPESSLEYTNTNMYQVVDTLLTTESSHGMWQVLRASGGFGGLLLGDVDERSRSNQELLPEVFGKLGGIAELKVLPILSASLPTAGNFDVELVVQGPASYGEMRGYAEQIIGKAYQSGKFMFADTDLYIDLPQVRFILKRDRIADLGMSLSSVSEQLSVLLSSNFSNRFDGNGKAFRVIPMLKESARGNPESFLNLQLRTPSGDMIPVSSIASLEKVTGPRLLGKFDQQKSFRIFGGVLPGTTREQGLSTIEEIAQEVLPAGFTLDYAGESRQLRKEGNTLMGVLIIALIVVYFVLTIQFNNFRDPLVILLGSVPLALAGAMLFPFLSLTTVNIYSQIGLVTLIGLIAKNGILIVEFAKQLQEEGWTKIEAVKEAAATRLRPVLMTTAATVLGHFPLVLVTGAGAEARNSIGIILVAGMLIGTVFTLVVLPVIYHYLGKDLSGQVAAVNDEAATAFDTSPKESVTA